MAGRAIVAICVLLLRIPRLRLRKCLLNSQNPSAHPHAQFAFPHNLSSTIFRGSPRDPIFQKPLKPQICQTLDPVILSSRTKNIWANRHMQAFLKTRLHTSPKRDPNNPLKLLFPRVPEGHLFQEALPKP